MSQLPAYILPQNKKKVLIPKTIGLILLGTIFYFGILLNISLLKLATSTESIIKLISLIIMLTAVSLGILLNLKKSKQNYFFYQDKIVFKKQQIFLNEITDIKTKQSLLDKLFKTYYLTINQKFKIKNISQKINLQQYLQKIINYSKTNY
jgi:hypothetical protein